MVKLNFEEVTELYDDGYFTLEGVYAYCDTDLDMYNFLKDHCGYDEETVEDKMSEVSGASDAYENALSYLI